MARRPDVRAAGWGEPRVGAGARRRRSPHELLARAGDALVIAVSHVSPIKAAVAWALGVGPEIAWRLRLDLASVTRIDRGPSVVSFNEPGFSAR